MEFGHRGFELGIPRLAEAADEGFAQKLIEADALTAAVFDGIAADVPPMIIKPDERMGNVRGVGGRNGTEQFLADGIEVATDGPGTQEAPLRATESAVAVIDNAGDEFALGVGIRHSRAVDGRLRRSGEAWPEGIQLFLDVGYLVHCDGCPRVALLAASAAAAGYVAGKIFGKDVGREQDIAYLNDGRQRTAVGRRGRKGIYHAIGVSPCSCR